jgi:hypothetical protein
MCGVPLVWVKIFSYQALYCSGEWGGLVILWAAPFAVPIQT